MNRAEVAAVLSLCSAFDSRTIGEADVLAWHEILGHVPFADARVAVTQHYAAESKRAMPADVLAGVRRIRRDRLDGADATFTMIGDPDDEAEYRRQIADHRKRVGDGEVITPPAIENPRDPRKAIESLAKSKKLPRKAS